MLRSKVFNVFSTIFILAGLAVGVYLVGVKTDFIKKASGTSANLVVDVGTSFVNSADCWKNLSQGGESKGRMFASVIPDIKKLQPQYIRIDHIYDNYDVVGRDPQGQLTFNWQNLDQTVQDIIASGATPFFSLSYMPIAISKDGHVESEPANWSDWQAVIQGTIEHYSGKHGMNLASVYYEVWNEPDLFGGYKISGDKNYLDLYYYAQAGAKLAQNVNSFKIGGPSTSGLYKAWVDAMMKDVSGGNIRLDFFSWHNYYGDTNNYDNDIQNISSWLAGYPNFQNIELIVSEMGINNKNDPAYDGNLSAIHTLSAITALQAKVSKCFNFEIIDGAGPTKLWGRWGMLTNEKYGPSEPKPRYYAIQFLNKMVGDGMSVSGNGSWVKSFVRYDGSKIRILISNYDYSGKHSEAVPLTLVNLPFRKFTIARINFLGATTTQAVTVNTNTWSTVEGLDPNTAAIFEITPVQ